MNQKRLRQMYGSTPPGFEQRVPGGAFGQSRARRLDAAEGAASQRGGRR